MSGEVEESGEAQPPIRAPDTAPTTGTTAVPQPSPGSGHGYGHHSIQFRFFDELKRRNVGRIAILYLVVCWLILEPVHVIFHMLEVPVWANRLVIILMTLGFPAVTIFAWVYEITPEGLKPTAEIPNDQSIRGQTGRRIDRAIIVVLVLALTYFVMDKFWVSKRVVDEKPVAAVVPATAPAPPALPEKSVAVLPFVDMSEKATRGGMDELPAAAPRTATNTPTATPTVAEATFAPPAHSIAVLPFVNMSADPQQEYFADGISEELLDSLSRLRELQVVARTSSFSFKGQNVDIATIAHKLNVRNILEGSVRRSGNTMRITVQLINAVTGFHLWSHAYDRMASDVLQVQSEVAKAVALQLEGTLAGGTSIFDLGGTTNPQAYDAFLRGIHLESDSPIDDEFRYRASLAMYNRAIALDPTYADAYAKRAGALTGLLFHGHSVSERKPLIEQALTSAARAVSIAPKRGELHMRLAQTEMSAHFDFAAAAPEFERALALAPGSAAVLSAYSEFAVNVGHIDSAVLSALRAVELDPRNSKAHSDLAYVYFAAGRYTEALAALQEAKRLAPADKSLEVQEIQISLAYGPNNQTLERCESPAVPLASDFRQYCLAVTYHAVGRLRDAERQLELMQQALGDAGAESYAELYALWGDRSRALQWLLKAEELHDPDLLQIRWAYPYASIRNDPVFKAVEARMKMPP